MTATPRMPRSQLAPDRLRGEQIGVLASWTPVMAVCSLACCLSVVITCWGAGANTYLAGLFVFLAAVHGLATFGARRWRARGTKVATPRMVRLRIAFTGLIAAGWATMPTVLMPLATPDQRQTIVYVGAGLMSASVLLAPLLPAALVFAGFAAAGILVPMLLHGQPGMVQPIIITVLFAATTCGVVFSQSRDHAKRLRNEIMLEEQGDVIALLLREFEENALDFL